MIAPLTPFPDDTRHASLSAADQVVQVVAQAASAGLPLADAIDAYCDETPVAGAVWTLRQMSAKLRQGMTLNEAVAATPSLPEYVGGLIQAATASNCLPLVLEQHLRGARRTSNIRWRFWLSAVYPLVLLAVALVVLTLILTVFVPQIRVIFVDYGVPLPGPTVATLTVSEWLTHLVQWRSSLLALPFLLTAVWCVRFLPGRSWRVRLWQRIPLFGSASRSVGLSEFCSLLSMLIECRMPLPRALRLTAGALRDPNLAEGSRQLAEKCEQGLPPDQEVAYLRNFPDSLAPLFRWEGRPDAFVSGLRAAAEMYAAQARVRTWLAGAFFQPISLLVVVLLIGGVTFTIFLPLIALFQSLT
jgi:type IV pilus assembly protein PilC